jgi:ABC-type protease/lipase transport system fused ATPase/permease subunit
MPNFDDLHYIFLTTTCEMEKYTYDFLNILTYVSILFFIVLYNQCLTKVEMWKLVMVSMSLFFLMTELMLVQALRLNEEAGISDPLMAAFIFIFGT